MKIILRSLVSAAPLVLLLAASPAHALYKVVGPDGKVTYTDRPPIGTSDKVTSISNTGSVVPADVALPLEIKQAAQRFPVTLYTPTECDPCTAARALLRQRGIPHTERLVMSAEDADALQRISGSRDTPTLMIGGQALRGFSTDLWNSYLDSAGYPRESRLPSNYQFQAATPLTVQRDATPAQATRSAPPAPVAPATPQPEPPPTGIRF